MGSEKTYKVTISRISSNIRNIRNKRGLSQADIADRGFDLRHFQRIEGGYGSPTVYTIQKIADILEVDIIELFKPIKKV